MQYPASAYPGIGMPGSMQYPGSYGDPMAGMGDPNMMGFPDPNGMAMGGTSGISNGHSSLSVQPAGMPGVYRNSQNGEIVDD